MEISKPIRLRSPRESLGGYILLPRLIDKVHLFAKGQLPEVYVANLLGANHTLDGRFLAFTGLNAEALRQAIVSSRSDQEVLAWVQDHAKPATALEKQAWGEQIDRYRPDAELLEYRRRMYPDLAARIELNSISVLDLIDLDEGRLPVQS
ncbi:MAG: DUF5069 domain-containing protein [Nitrospira sp.]